MIEIRIHGRGGQGAVIASKILAAAIFSEGRYVQSFPAFGVERRGAPVAAFTRIDAEPIRIRNAIYEPDHIMVLDPGLVSAGLCTDGLKKGGIVLINSPLAPEEFSTLEDYRVATVDAGGIAQKHRLGSANSPIVNTTILGAFAKVSKIVKLESLVACIGHEVPVKPEANGAACTEAFETVKAVNRR